MEIPWAGGRDIVYLRPRVSPSKDRASTQSTNSKIHTGHNESVGNRASRVHFEIMGDTLICECFSFELANNDHPEHVSSLPPPKLATALPRCHQ